jgi:hypothetical protein
MSGSESIISLDRMEINQAETDKHETLASEGVVPPVPLLADLVKSPDAPSVLAALGHVQLSLVTLPQASVSNPFTVKINLSAVELQNASLDLSFDPDRLKVVSVIEGDILKIPDGKAQFMHQVQPKAGRINLVASRQGNMKGEGTFASITFQPLASGTAQLRVGTASFSDAAGRVLPFSGLLTATINIVK